MRGGEGGRVESEEVHQGQKVHYYDHIRHYNTQHSACFTTAPEQHRLYIPDLASKDVVA